MKVLIGLIVLSFVLTAQAKVVVGQVNMQKVITSISAGTKIRTKIKAKFDRMQKEVKGEEAKIKKLQENYQKQTAVLSAAAKAKKERDIQGKIMELQKKTMGYQQTIQKMEQKLMQPILKNLKIVIDVVSKSSNVDFTVEMSSAPVIYAKSPLDITDKVIKAYDKKYPSK